MTYKLDLVKYSLIGFLGLALFASFGVSYVKANPSFFIRANTVVCGTYTASSTPTFMSAGLATTSVTFDTGCAAAGNVDSAILLAQLTASSTATTVNINYEYSQDGVDWYQSNLSNQGTTTPVQSVTTPQSYGWTFASTTPGMGAPLASGTFANRQMKAIEVRTPSRYVRAIFTMPAGSTAGAVWAEFTAKRQAI